MRPLDKVIGYDEIKKELYEIIDYLNNTEKYEKLGVKGPRGILFEGVPGMGKTLTAKCFIEECNRKAFTLRKDKPDGEFVNCITDIFRKAVEEAPSIVFLDDMDKFAEEDNRLPEEYVAIQSGIDGVRDKDVFVIATVNDSLCLPGSLLRKGRFDKKLFFDYSEKHAADIIRNFIKDKPVDKEVDIETIVKFTEEKSCADMESILNLAAIRAVYSGNEIISEEDIIKTCLRELHGVDVERECGSADVAYRYSIHEAGHLMVSELLSPGSVNFAAIRKHIPCGRGFGGVVCRKYDSAKRHLEEGITNRIKIALAGKAATEIIFGEVDLGANNDLHKAFDNVRDLLDSYSSFDFHSWCHGRETAESVYQHLDISTGTEMSRYYKETKKILIDNRELLLKLADELMKKSYLTHKDIKRIMKG